MDLQRFLIFIGILLVASIILIAIVKNYVHGFASGAKPIFYGLLSSAIVAAASSLLTFVSRNMFAVFWYMGALLFLFGIIHGAFSRKRYFYSYKKRADKILAGEILFGLSIVLFMAVLFSAIEYFIKKDRNFLFYPMLMSTLAFFVPLFVFHTFEAAFRIPEAKYRTWQYPLHERIEYPEDDNEKLIMIGYKIAKKYVDPEKKSFRGKAPESMTLGEAYYHFLNDYNDLQGEIAIEYADDSLEPYEWWFHKQVKWFQRRRILDPDLTVRENRIQENSVIICERLPTLIHEHQYHERSA